MHGENRVYSNSEFGSRGVGMLYYSFSQENMLKVMGELMVVIHIGENFQNKTDMPYLILQNSL